MVIKKLLKTGACFAAMALIVRIYISPSIARASYDKGYGFGFDYDGQTKFTNTEDKNTYSSIGMECTDSEDEYAYYVARVFGVDESDEDFDYSHGYEYTFYEGTSYEMLNWVKENDCHKAKVRGIGYRIDTEDGNVFSGYWSPDLY